MFSDSIFEVMDSMFGAIRDYGCQSDHRESIELALYHLRLTLLSLDNHSYVIDREVEESVRRMVSVQVDRALDGRCFWDVKLDVVMRPRVD